MGSSPFYFPEVDSPFLNLYNRFSTDPRSGFGGDYLDPSDPDFQNYLDLAAKPTGSEDLIRDYVSRRPTYESYNPSFGRRMASFLLGTLGGGGYAGAQRHLYQPFEQELQDWEREGTGITARARLLDAERQRELAAMKYGLQARGQAGRAEALDEFRRQGESRRMAEEVTAEEERASDRAFRRGVAESLERAREERFDLSQQIHEDRQAEIATRRTEREEALKREEAKIAEKEAELGNINKRLDAFASQRGIHTKGLTAYDMATAAAYESALNNPVFKNMIIRTSKGYKFANPNDPKIEALKAHIDYLRRSYLRGEF